MGTLLQLFLKNGGLITFLLVEVFCFMVIVNHNTTQAEIYAHTSALVSGHTLRLRQNVSQYFGMAQRVDSLAADNSRLKSELYALKNRLSAEVDTMVLLTRDTQAQTTLARPQYTYISAEIISNNLYGRNNWLIINKGKADGITPNSAVVAQHGLVGIVRHVSDRFALVMSVLHSQSRISARLENSQALGSIVWKGANPKILTLKDIPKHITVAPGDLVRTSGYSYIFPKDLLIGAVNSIHLEPGSNFYEISVNMINDMSKLHTVYVVKNIHYSELEALNKLSTDGQ